MLWDATCINDSSTQKGELYQLQTKQIKTQENPL